MLRILSDEGTSALPTGPDSVMLQQLKEKCEETTNTSVKVIVLTRILKECSIRKYKKNFLVTV
jgi:hydroxylamine reductase (hybrid-cluster protein)